jgi:hypothetical protein
VVFTGIAVLLGVSLILYSFVCISKHSTQVVKDVIASYETLINLFERTQYFLQRLNHYTATSLTPEMMELLAKILAQVLSVLALSTKEMKERRISALISRYTFLADYGAEKFMKRLVGKTEVEDGLQRLDMLTKEENLMTAACTLEVAGDIRQNVNDIKEDTCDIKDDTRDIKDDTHDIKEDTRNIKDIKEDTRNINDNLEINKRGASFLQCLHIRTNLSLSYTNIAIDELQCLLLSVYHH